MQTRGVFLQEAGYQVLLFDLRGNGESGPSPISGGFLESGDFLAAAVYLAATHRLQKPMVFFGFSLGAICALRAGVDGKADALIADSPLPNVKSYVSRRTLGAPFCPITGVPSRVLQAYDAQSGLHLTDRTWTLSRS